jgi:hypothetical protein
MKCQRTGWCCVGLDVVIATEIAAGKLELFHKPSGAQCPNLTFREVEGLGFPEASCGVHDRDWYKETPCYTYQNSEIDPDYGGKSGKPCKLGPHYSNRLVQPHWKSKKLDVRELTSLGTGKACEFTEGHVSGSEEGLEGLSREVEER